MPDRQTVHAPAGLPINETTRAELLDAGGANRSNVNVRQDDRLALNKRLGFGVLPSAYLDGSERTSGRKLLNHKGSPAIITTDSIDVFFEAQAKSVSRGRVCEATYRLIDTLTPFPDAAIADMVYCAGFLAIMYGDAGDENHSLPVAIVEANTGIVVSEATTLGTYTYGSLATCSDRYVFAFMAFSGALTVYRMDLQDMGSGWTSIETTADIASIQTAACSMTEQVAVACANNFDAQFMIRTYDASGLVTFSTFVTADLVSAIDIDADSSDDIWLAWKSADGYLNAQARDADLNITGTEFILHTIGDDPVVISITAGPANKSRVVAEQSAGMSSTHSLYISGLQITAGAVARDGSDHFVYNAALSSHSFYLGARYYAFVAAGSEGTSENTQRNCILVDWTEDDTWLRPLGNIQPGLVHEVLKPTTKVPLIDAATCVFGFQCVKVNAPTVTVGPVVSSMNGCVIAEIKFDSIHRWQNVAHAGSTVISGAMLSVFDGHQVTEAGFLASPSAPTAELDAMGLTGTFRYVAIYEDIDASGNWVVSGISLPSDEVVAADNSITISLRTLTVSSRSLDDSVRIAVYRTLDGGLPPYYRAGAVDNDTSADLVEFQDTVSDAELAEHAKLYAPNLPGAVGESLDRRAPPGAMLVESYNGMLVGAWGSTFYFSGQEVYGEATWYSSLFSVPLTLGGDFTAIKALDGVLFLFKRSCIFAVTGEAPSDNGQLGGFGSPRLLASDVGCLDASSVVVTSFGIFFRSARGYEILTRSQQVEPIGDPVGVTVGTYPATTAAVLDERNSLVRISLAVNDTDGAVISDGEGVDGVDIVYDLTNHGWISVDHKLDTDGNIAPTQSAALVNYDDEWRYAWLAADGKVYVERDRDDGDAHLDGGFWVPMQYEIPPVKVGLQQEQRMYEMEFLFERHTQAGLLIEVANDYGEYAAVTDDKVWTDVEIQTVGRQVAFRPKPRGMSIQLRITDVEPTTVIDAQIPVGNGKGLTFIGLSADIAAEQRITRGTMRIAASARR
jgi:hypothetical protein